MDWVHYLNDPTATEWGRLRASNGHPEPYGVRLFQIDNEPMNNGFTPEKYAEIVNVYGSRLRAIAPKARIVACGQKRSNDMDLEPEDYRPRRRKLRRPRLSQLRVRTRELRDRAERIRDYL